jgi:CRP-like cAMP-binding protein
VENTIGCDKSDLSNRTCANCSSRKNTLFADLSGNELESLNAERYAMNYEAGEVIYKAGMKSIGLMCLHEGKVKINRTGPAGNDQIISLRKDGDFIGLRALMKNEKYLNSAVAIAPTSICIIPETIFAEVIKENAALCLKVLNHFIDKLKATEQLHLNHSQKHMRARMADALLQIHQVYGQDVNNGYLNVNLKRAEIAALSNMTSSNAIRILSAFAEEKLIELNKREIKIKNISALEFLSVSG